ncbi:MAG: hypothetical protein WEB94_01085 [Candidatus Paceibacterota bacterium]
MKKKESSNLSTIETSTEEAPKTPAEKVSELFIHTAIKHLQNDPELKQTVLDYYSDIPRLDRELSNVFANQNHEEIDTSISRIETRFQDPQEFKGYVTSKIEAYQSTTERANSFRRRDARIQNNPLASPAEYELGSYKDALENSVADAVFTLHDKGYSPFESGMDENASSREQFIGLYDTKITLPDELIEDLEDQGFALYIAELPDRTQIRLNPLNDSPVRSSDWKKIWDQLAEQIPVKKKENLWNRKKYTYHQEFRGHQDRLRAEQELNIKETAAQVENVKTYLKKFF